MLARALRLLFVCGNIVSELHHHRQRQEGNNNISYSNWSSSSLQPADFPEIYLFIMSTNFYKAEILNIANEMMRIADRANELMENKEVELDWPPYCEVLKLAQESKVL